MRSVLVTSLAVVLVASVFSPAKAALTPNRLLEVLGSDMCKLSVPTIDSKVRPRATGFRNEGTTNQFVICTMHTNNGPNGTFSSPLFDAGLLVTSYDGVARDVTCTAVNSFSVFGDQQFVPKTQNTNGGFVQFWWAEADFGVSDGSGIPTSGVFSITCILPPGTSLDLGLSNYYEDIGT